MMWRYAATLCGLRWVRRRRNDSTSRFASCLLSACMFALLLRLHGATGAASQEAILLGMGYASLASSLLH
ncbi:hypothetical protein EON66_05215 [archaeon]|nr:MAG: hypothetical protein EON66_05215 [archaeon]